MYYELKKKKQLRKKKSTDLPTVLCVNDETPDRKKTRRQKPVSRKEAKKTVILLKIKFNGELHNLGQTLYDLNWLNTVSASFISSIVILKRILIFFIVLELLNLFDVSGMKE